MRNEEWLIKNEGVGVSSEGVEVSSEGVEVRIQGLGVRNYEEVPGEVLGEEVSDSVDTGMTFSPTTDTSKAKAVAISDAYTDSLFSAVLYSPLVTLDASGRNNAIYLTGNGQKNKIIGGKGNDTLFGGEGADNLTGGDGADIFFTSAGKDVITDYSDSQGDVIVLNNVTPTKVKVSKSNVVITNSDGSALTINNGKGVKLNVRDINGNEINSLNQAFGDTELVVSSQESVVSGAVFNATLNTSIKTIDASNATVEGATGLTIIGNAKANSIIGSDYVDNTIIAGAGKDTLTGGGYHIETITDTLSSGSTTSYESLVHVHNTFVFSEGQGSNVITNYNSATDYIQISSGTVYSYKTKNDDVIFTIALDGKKKTTLTVRDGKNKLITFLNADGSVDTGNTMVYRNVTDYIVTTQATVSPALVSVVDRLGDKVKVIDASTGEYQSTKGVYIEGNKAANSIVGSRFSDTITGGKGKDTFSGGHSTIDVGSPCYDTYLIYSGQGNKVITDYVGTSDPTLSDVIKLANPDTTISTSALSTKKGAADVVLVTTSAKGKLKGTVTLKGVGDSLVTVVKAPGTSGSAGSEVVVAPQRYGKKELIVGADVYPVNIRLLTGRYSARVDDPVLMSKYEPPEWL